MVQANLINHTKTTGTTSDRRPIGVFDSGMGGLTVLRALKEKLPHESFVYLGDTARLPYGTKSQATVKQYALKMTEILVSRGIKMLIIACNTATAAALPFLRERYPEMPILGVVEPGALAATKASWSHQYALLATETTIRSNVYQRALTQLVPAAQIRAQSCGLFVALAEENCIFDAVTRAAVKKYLAPIFSVDHNIDTIILGCTHFPVLMDAIRSYVGNTIHIIDSAEATALMTKQWLTDDKMLSDNPKPSIHFLVTDLPERFCRIGQVFLGEDIQSVEMAELASTELTT